MSYFDREWSTTRSYVSKIINTHTHTKPDSGTPGRRMGEAEASRAPSITPLSERDRERQVQRVGDCSKGKKRNTKGKEREEKKEKRNSDGNKGEGCKHRNQKIAGRMLAGAADARSV